MHETTAHERDTLAHWLLEKYPEIRGVGEAPERPGIVHRLDEASGLLVVAKTQAMFEHLRLNFRRAPWRKSIWFWFMALCRLNTV